MSSDYEVGYGKPPPETQFKKGQSGNLRGRPRKDVSQRGIVEKVLGEKQRLNGQPRGARVRYTLLELVIMAIKQRAASGHGPATKLFLMLKEKYTPQETTGEQRYGFLVVPEVLTEEEWVEKYSPKDDLPLEEEWGD